MMSVEIHNADAGVGNSVFLEELARAAPRGSVLWTAAFIGNPDGHPGWGGTAYWGTPEQRAEIDSSYSRMNSYFSVAALRPGADGNVRRTKEHFARLLALVVDDANTVDLRGRPSWVLRTSPGKCQVGILLDGADADCADLALVSALVTRMTREGLIGGDRSGNNACRYVRLPRGQNQKPRESGAFQCELAAWHPQARYTLEDAAAILGIDLDELRAQQASSPAQPGSGAFQGEQADKLTDATRAIIAGHDLHDACITVAASLVASRMPPGAVVNHLRALMNASQAVRDPRWKARFDDIPRCVETAVQKFARPEHALAAEPEQELFEDAGNFFGPLVPIKFLVDGYFEREALGVMYGPPGSGKSFVSIDLACSVATGKPWHGLQVNRGRVFCLIGEGFGGYRRRIRAWAKKHGAKPEDIANWLFVSRRPSMLTNEGAAAWLIEQVEAMCRAVGELPSLFLIDTLARNFGDGDENSAESMGAFIRACDEIKAKLKCHVLVIHHSGKDATRGARGHSSLKGAADQEFSVQGSMGQLTVECQKMKDAETPPARSFRLVQLELGLDQDGEPVRGAALELVGGKLDFEVAKTRGGAGVTARQIVQAVGVDRIESQKALCIDMDVPQASMNRAFKHLESLGLLVRRGLGKYGATDDAVAELGITGPMPGSPGADLEER